MAVQKARDALRQIMKAQGLSQRQLARTFGVGDSFISLLVAGKRDLRVCDLSRHIGQLGWEIHVAPIPREEDPVKRRNFLTAAASVTFIPSPSTTPYQDPAYVRGLAARLEVSLYSLGGISLASTALRLVANTREAEHKGGKDLQAAASDLARAASTVLYDARQIPSAESLGSLALRLARRAGHTYGVGKSYEDLCLYARHNDPAKAAHLAQVGLRTPDLSSERRVRLNARLAAVLALSRRSDRVTKQLAHDALERAHSAADIEPVSRAVILGCAGQSYAGLRRYDDANSAFEEALRGFAKRPLNDANWRLTQIQATLGSGDLGRAAEQIRVVAGIIPLVNSAKVDIKVSEVLRSSEQWRTVPEVREARECLRAAAGP